VQSKALRKASRVTESAKEIVDSIPYICEHYTYVYQMSSLLSYCWEDVLQEYGDFTWRVSDCEELVGVTHIRWWVGFMALSIHMFAMKLFWEEKESIFIFQEKYDSVIVW